jgi:hypothetical protein
MTVEEAAAVCISLRGLSPGHDEARESRSPWGDAESSFSEFHLYVHSYAQ